MAARDDILIDPVFGALRQTSSGSFWRGKYASRKFGKISLNVLRRRTITKSQHHAFDLFKLNEDQIFKDAQASLYEIYNIYLIPNEGDPFQSLENLIPLSRSEQIWGLLDKPFNGGTSLGVLYSREHSVYLELGWNCSWDVEHGTSVCIENGKVVSIKRWSELR
jgi:hypothetical protein